MLTPESRHPRGIVLLNGVRVAWIDIEINNNGYYQADTFRITVPVKGQDPQIDKYWWVNQEQVDVDIYIGFPLDHESYSIADLDLMLSGSVDVMPHELVTDIITLTGRDYTSKFIDTKTTMRWPNKSSSVIATMLATKYGLTSKVTSTKAKVGIYFKDSTKLQAQASEWDLLTFLAKKEGFQVYVKGEELHFEPKSASAPVYNMQWVEDENGNKHFDGTSLTFERNLTLARDVIVRVDSWNRASKKVITAEARAVRSKDKTLMKKVGLRVGQPQMFTFSIPNLTREQAVQAAQSKLREITRHQLKMLAMGIPADNILTPQHIVTVSGTPYDQNYNPDSITRMLSKRDGYTMDVMAKNHDVNSDVPLVGSH